MLELVAITAAATQALKKGLKATFKLNIEKIWAVALVVIVAFIVVLINTTAPISILEYLKTSIQVAFFACGGKMLLKSALGTK